MIPPPSVEKAAVLAAFFFGNSYISRITNQRTTMRFLTAILSLLITIGTARGEGYTFLGNCTSHARNGATLTLTATNNVMRITVIDSATVRVQVGRDGRILDIPSYAIDTITAPPAAWVLEEKPDRLVMRLAGGIVEILKSPLRLRFLTRTGAELCADDSAFGHAWDGHEVMTWKRLDPSARFYGLGEKTGNLDKRGNQWVMWNTDFPAYGVEHDPLYVSIPFFIGVVDAGAYGIFFDNTYRSVFTMGAGSRRTYSFGAPDGEMTYHFFFGPEMKRVITHYTALTGRMPLPPRWALGYQQCRWSYFPAAELMDVARNFRTRRIPADVLYLDIRHMDRYKVFTWDTAAFPDPPAMLAELRRMGFHVVPIIDPGIKVEKGFHVDDEGVKRSLFARHADGTLYEGEVWPGWCHFPDFTRPDTRAWWGAHYARLFDQGVAGFWNDMNEPAVWGREMPTTVVFDDDRRNSTIRKIHNVYAHLEARAAYEGLRAHAPDMRPFLLTRAAYAGSQKYTAIWTGDNVASFDHLALAVRMCIGLGLSGAPFVGADVGGFVGSPSPELFARWMQAGVFTPLFRNHTTINSRDQEPWTFGEEIEDNARDMISLRYELMPYIYTIFREASLTGIPMMRAMQLEFQDEPESYRWDVQHQFMFGSSILVAPVVNEHQYFQKVWLPRGRWLDPVTNDVHDGGRFVTVDAPWWRLPCFFRVGSIIPRRAAVQYDNASPLTELTVDVVAGADGAFTLYLDAGDGFGCQRGEYDEIAFAQNATGSSLTINATATQNSFAADIGTHIYRIRNFDGLPASVTINGHSAIAAHDGSRIPDRGYHVDAGKHMLVVRVPAEPALRIVVTR